MKSEQNTKVWKLFKAESFLKLHKKFYCVRWKFFFRFYSGGLLLRLPPRRYTIVWRKAEKRKKMSKKM